MNRAAFFAAVRASLFGGRLSQPQTDGFNAILDEWEKRGGGDVRHLAYILATAFHETAHTMQPIREYGRGKGRKYGVKGKHGQVAYGRGYVQLTWDYNYEKADKQLGLGGVLSYDYELALRPDIAAAIMFRGMSEGWFTGKKLDTYINAGGTDYRQARRIINGLDKASLIAGYASDFEAALRAGGTVQAVRPEAPPAPVEPPPIPDTDADVVD